MNEKKSIKEVKLKGSYRNEVEIVGFMEMNFEMEERTDYVLLLFIGRVWVCLFYSSSFVVCVSVSEGT